MKLKEFMIQSPTGKTHAINPKTNRTYCGHPRFYADSDVRPELFEDLGWRFLDILPDKNHEPTCTICKRHYDDPLTEELTSIANELKQQISEYLDLRIILKDAEAVGRFTEVIANFMREERKRKDFPNRTEESP